MAETEEPLPPQTLFEIMKYGRTERTVVVGALRMPQSLTSMEGDMPTPRAKVVKKDVKFNDKLEVSSAELQVATAKEKEPSSTDSPKANENLKDAEDHANKETTDDMTTPKQSAQHVQHTQQSETKTFEEKTRFSKVVPPTGLISIFIDIPSNTLIKIKNAAFEIATAFSLMLTLGMLFIVPDYIWNRFWPTKPLDVKARMEKQNREEKEFEKQMGYFDGHRRRLSDEISDLGLEKVGGTKGAAKEDKGKGKEVIAGEKTVVVQGEKAS